MADLSPSGGVNARLITNANRLIQALNVSVAIPSIAANSTQAVAISGISATINGVVYQPQPGDVINASAAPGSAAIPANIGLVGLLCSTAGTVTYRFANLSNLTASTAMTILSNVEWNGP